MIMGQGPQTAGELSARAAALAEHLPDVLYTVRVEPDVACEFVSAAIVDVVGYTPEQHYDDPLFPMRLVAQADRPLLLQLAEQPVGPLVEFTARWIADDGREVWMQHRCRKHRRPDGSVVVLGSAREVRAPGSTDAAPGLVVLRPLETAPVDPEAWARESDVGPDPTDWSGISVGLVTEEYLDSLRRGDEHAAIRIARHHLRQGVAPVDVLDHLVAEGQRLVGEAWLATAWSVADEHIATSVADQVQAALVADSSQPPIDPTVHRPQVLVACAAGETHTLPARMLADHLRLAGCRTVFLGAATKGQLHALVHHWEPDVIVLSCTMVPNLPGLAESLSAVSDARCPVVVGGAAVPGPEIAARLGADAWQPDAVALTDFVLGEPTRSARRMAARSIEIPELSAGDDGRLAALLLRSLVAHAPGLSSLDTWALADIVETLENLMRSATAAQLVAEPSLFETQAMWAARYLEVRGAPGVLRAALEEVAAATAADLPRTAALLTQAASCLGASPPT